MNISVVWYWHLSYAASGEITNYYLQFTLNKLSIEIKLFMILFKLAQSVNFLLTLI